MRFTKLTLLIVILLHLLFNVVATEEGGGGDLPPDDPKATEDFQNTVENADKTGQTIQQVSPGNANLATSVGDISVPSGSTVSVSPSGIYSSKVDAAKTPEGTTLSGCKEVYVFRNKEVQVESCKYFSTKNVQVTNANKITSTPTTLTISSSQHLQLRIPNSNDFWNIPNATDITITFAGNNIQNVRMTLPDTPIIVPNPLRLDPGQFQTIGDLNDADNDGLSDSFETINQMNANNKDTDGDGLTDYEEVMLYPTSAKSAKTYDGTWQNDKEFAQQLRANPTMLKEAKELKILNILNDRDADGISDLNELKYKTDYNAFDTDEDGYGDGYELTKGMNPLIPDGAGNKPHKHALIAY